MKQKTGAKRLFFIAKGSMTKQSKEPFSGNDFKATYKMASQALLQEKTPALEVFYRANS